MKEKIIHLVVGFVACLGLILLSFASKKWGLEATTQASIAGFLGLVLWNVRSILFRSPSEKVDKDAIQ